MKRRDFLRATGAAAVALIVSGPPAQGADDYRGAVKAVFDPDDGWAILNTNAQNELIVQLHLARGLPETTYGIKLDLSINGGVVLPDVGSLTTNGEGNGNAHIVVPLDPADSDTAVGVQVILDAGA